MTTGLYLPQHLAKKKTKSKKTGAESDTDKLPKPTGWRILVMPHTPPKTTKGGIELPDTVVERERVATVVGLVMDMGPLCYKDTTKFGPKDDWGREWCKRGDWVIFARYAGSRFKIEGGELRLLNDDEILAVVEDPEFLVHT